MKTALSIAGSDSCGGAGVQADLKTMTMNGVFAMSAITALTAQNTTGVRAIYEVPADFLKQQIDAVFEDIRPDAVKIGMVSSVGLIEAIAERLRFYQAKNIVVDPVMVATSGARLISPDAVETLEKRIAAPGDGPDAEYPGGGGPLGARHCKRRRNDRRREVHRRDLRLRRALQGRPQRQRRQRPSLCGRQIRVVPRQEDRQSQHARHRLHAFQRHRREPCEGIRSSRVRQTRQGLYFRRAFGDARSWGGQRPDEPRLCALRRVPRLKNALIKAAFSKEHSKNRRRRQIEISRDFKIILSEERTI